MTSKDTARVAAIQMNTRERVAANLDAARGLLAEAAAAGAELAVLPENFALMSERFADMHAAAEADGDGPIQAFLAATAAELGLWLVAGTIPLRATDPERVAPACLVYDASGQRVARYDKIHLFDVGMPDSSESYRESARYVAGPPAAQVIDTPIGLVGLSVCYDLRFAELYRALAAAGAELVVAPSAFTETTGRAHWHVLVRARAIENQVALIAPGQYGDHPNGRSTYGHSLIVDAWGQMIAKTDDAAPSALVADIDRALTARIRAGFPVAAHHRIA